MLRCMGQLAEFLCAVTIGCEMETPLQVGNIQRKWDVV
jgi:hypothetical protein